MFPNNPLLTVDSYKFSHFKQIDPSVKAMSAYIEARKGGRWNDGIVFFGLQAFLHELEERPITKSDVQIVAEMARAHGVPFNREGFDHIIDHHEGFFPVYIYALPEGTVVDAGVPMVRVTSEDGFAWAATFIETALLRAVWYPTTVATLSRKCKETIWNGLLKSSDDPAGQIAFKLHDFGARGVSSAESARLGGMAHLVNFKGTDTFEALWAAERYYDSRMAGFSIPAAEHSTVTSWGMDRESDAYQHMVDEFGHPGALFAVVSDSYDLENAVKNLWCGTLKQKVIDCGGTLVVRPDSGDPVDTPIKTLEMLLDSYGFTVNSKGYKVLNNSVRLIQGDGMNPEMIRDLVGGLLVRGISIDNIAFGMGGGLLQNVNRDTLRFAMKASAVLRSDEVGWEPIAKMPKTDPTKGSKAGVQGAILNEETGKLEPYTLPNWVPVWKTDDALKLTWSGATGHCASHTFDEIRERAAVR